MMHEIQMMQSAVEINQDYANYLLYMAWDKLRLSDLFFNENDDSATLWMIYEGEAQAYLNAWETYTNIELVYGKVELHKISESQWAEIAEENPLIAKQLQNDYA